MNLSPSYDIHPVRGRLMDRAGRRGGFQIGSVKESHTVSNRCTTATMTVEQQRREEELVNIRFAVSCFMAASKQTTMKRDQGHLYVTFVTEAPKVETQTALDLDWD